jgi:LysM repeat protein
MNYGGQSISLRRRFMKFVARLTLIGMVLIFSSLAACPALAEQPAAQSIFQSPIDTPTPTLPPVATATPAPPTATRPAPTATPFPTGAPPIYPILGNHTVRYGESLFCIGRAYTVSPWAIAQVNGIVWPYPIYPNQVLKVPNVPWGNPPAGPVCPRQFGSNPPPVTPGPSPTPTPPVNPPGCRATYNVVWGDTLYSIALRYNSNVYSIAQANHISNINLIYVGQRLCIP